MLHSIERGLKKNKKKLTMIDGAFFPSPSPHSNATVARALITSGRSVEKFNGGLGAGKKVEAGKFKNKIEMYGWVSSGKKVKIFKVFKFFGEDFTVVSRL